MTNIINEEFKKIGLKISGEQVEKLSCLGSLLVETNSKYNLTSIIEPRDIVMKHFLDSAAILKYSRESLGSNIIDVGTGGGFPGMVLAILLPEVKFTLLEATSKKTEYLKLAVGKLNLQNVEILNARAEEAGREPKFRENFDTAVSRAVSEIRVLFEYMSPFVKPGGNIICFKAGEPEEEIDDAKNSLSILGGGKGELIKFEMPYGGRSFFIVEKKSSTPEKYPRRPGVPLKKPL